MSPLSVCLALITLLFMVPWTANGTEVADATDLRLVITRSPLVWAQTTAAPEPAPKRSDVRRATSVDVKAIRAGFDAERLPPLPTGMRLEDSQIGMETGRLDFTAGRGDMASVDSARRDLSDIDDLMNPALASLGGDLRLDGDGSLPSIADAFPGDNGFGTKSRVRLDVNMPLDHHLRVGSAVSLSGAHDLAVAYAMPSRGGFDLQAATAIGVNQNAGDLWRVDGSISLRQRATGWTATLASGHGRRADGRNPLQFYAKLGREFPINGRETAVVAVDAAHARQPTSDARSATAFGVAGKYKIDGYGQFFVGFRWYGAATDTTRGNAQQLVAGGRWRF